MDVRTHCCKRAAALLACAAIALPGIAAGQPAADAEGAGRTREPLASNPDAEWLERSREILEAAEQAPVPAWLTIDLSEQLLDDALAIGEASARRAAGVSLEADGFVLPQRDAPPGAPGEARVLVFGSLSLPDATLRNLLDQASEPNVVFVLRGLAPGAGGGLDFRATQGRIEALANIERGRIPSVIVDPTLYRQHDVTVVPTLVLERTAADGAAVPVRVTGAVPVDWLRRQARRARDEEAVDLGRRAEVHEIGEEDLVLAMQRRVAETDFSGRRQAAIDRFWSSRRFVRLPDAPENAAFEVDPSVRVTADITDLNGRVLIAAGERFNPLDAVPLTKTVVVFRGTDPRHVARAAELASEVRQAGRGVILLTTEVAAADGWRAMERLEYALQGPVYLLFPDVAERFHLRHAPATVRAQGTRLIVEEWAP